MEYNVSLAVRPLGRAQLSFFPDKGGTVVVEQLAAMLSLEGRLHDIFSSREQQFCRDNNDRQRGVGGDSEKEEQEDPSKTMASNASVSICSSVASSSQVVNPSRTDHQDEEDTQDYTSNATARKKSSSNSDSTTTNNDEGEVDVSCSLRDSLKVKMGKLSIHNHQNEQQETIDTARSNSAKSRSIAVTPSSNQQTFTARQGLYRSHDETYDEERHKYAIYRLRMSEWAYRIIDHFGASRENVAVSFEYLDRFYATGLFPCTSSFDYKLASITALYIALKVHNRTTIKASTLSTLSRGEITVGDIIAMETMMLDALSYHLCPPTCFTFVNLFYALVPVSVRDTPAGPKLLQHAVFLTELSVMDVSFQSLKASHISLAAMLNAMDGILMGAAVGEDDGIDPPRAGRSSTISLDCRSQFIRNAEECLLKLSIKNDTKTQGSAVAYDDCRECVSPSSNYEQWLLSRTALWRNVDRARHMLYFIQSNGKLCIQQEKNMFSFESFYRSENNFSDVLQEGRDDVPTATFVSDDVEERS